MRIALQRLLNLHGKAVHASTHVPVHLWPARPAHRLAAASSAQWVKPDVYHTRLAQKQDREYMLLDALDHWAGGTVRLTIYTDYSLRLLMYLAVREGRLVTIGEVADAYGIAKNHLTKVVHQLGVAGDIETVRGKGGGIRLKNSAESINLGAVIRRTEPDLALVPCFDRVDACAIGKACLLQTTLHDALAAFLAVLDRTTLADVVAPRRKLAALLGLGPTEASRGRATATQRTL
jgi:Rrf2 family nitric oxide-sensitive transcriptional repressor